MTVYIPTGELVGLINDVAPLAGQEKEIERTHAIRLQFDGEAVHAMATDDTRMGVSTWHPDDLPEEATQEGLFSRRGVGGDNPWSIVLSLPDALDVAKKFKLSEKNAWVPLGLDFVEGITDNHRLRIARNTDQGLTGLSMVVRDRDVDLPDVRRLLDMAPAEAPVSRISFNGAGFAAFGDVRQRGGALEATFAGPDGLISVAIGERFRGSILPVRAARRLSVAA